MIGLGSLEENHQSKIIDIKHQPTFIYLFIYFFFFVIYVGCPGQLTRTTTIPHGPLDILQAQEQVRHRGGDRRTHRGSNPGWGRNKSHEVTTAVKPSSAGYTQELEPGHSGRAKPAKATELQAPCVTFIYFIIIIKCRNIELTFILQATNQSIISQIKTLQFFKRQKQ
jgi:hypothetical protein